jgi:hypothetical protein
MQALINRATDQNNNDNERRNAAIAACKLFKEFKVISMVEKLINAYERSPHLVQAVLDGRISF